MSAKLTNRIRYAIVGAGGRSATYMDAIAGPHREHAELVAMCDPSPTRMAWHKQRLAEQLKSAPPASYAPDDFDRMIREQRPQSIIITVPDYLHHDFVIRAMHGGCDVICEKPLTIDAPKLRAIFDAMKQTGRNLRVTLNARYMPEMLAVRRLMLEGVVGRVLAVDLSWVLDTSHGADFFRRWHREKDKSGGLLIHKASHHFDLVNWFIDSWPQQIFALGELKFYGKANAAARGETYSYDRYTGSADAAADPFAIALDRDEATRKLYLEAERDSGYVRDRNVFGEGITIEDTIALTARYRNGALLSYSLLAYSPWEGLRLAITGTKGRVELYVRYGAHVTRVPPGRENQADLAAHPIRRITVFPMFGVPYEIAVGEEEGGHGGADPAMMNDLFLPTAVPDPLGCRSDARDAAASVLIGICANQSMTTGGPVNCDDIFPLPHEGSRRDAVGRRQNAKTKKAP